MPTYALAFFFLNITRSSKCLSLSCSRSRSRSLSLSPLLLVRPLSCGSAVVSSSSSSSSPSYSSPRSCSDSGSGSRRLRARARAAPARRHAQDADRALLALGSPRSSVPQSCRGRRDDDDASEDPTCDVAGETRAALALLPRWCWCCWCRPPCWDACAACCARRCCPGAEPAPSRTNTRSPLQSAAPRSRRPRSRCPGCAGAARARPGRAAPPTACPYDHGWMRMSARSLRPAGVVRPEDDRPARRRLLLLAVVVLAAAACGSGASSAALSPEARERALASCWTPATLLVVLRPVRGGEARVRSVVRRDGGARSCRHRDRVTCARGRHDFEAQLAAWPAPRPKRPGRIGWRAGRMADGRPEASASSFRERLYVPSSTAVLEEVVDRGRVRLKLPDQLLPRLTALAASGRSARSARARHSRPSAALSSRHVWWKAANSLSGLMVSNT